jgi:hypothetical protein
MKPSRFFLAMTFWVVLLQGASLAAQASPAPPQATSQSGGRSVDQQNNEVRNDQDTARPKEADENQEQSAYVTRTTSKRGPSASHFKPVPSHQVHSAKTRATNSPRTDALGSVSTPQQTGSKAATALRNKAASHHSPSAGPSAASANGQQFRNSRNPGARLAVSGGPPSSPRGTAAISGTNMKRKP